MTRSHVSPRSSCFSSPTAIPALVPALALVLWAGCACDLGGIEASTRTDVAGDNESNVTVDDVAIDRLEVDAETEIDANVDTNVDTDVENNIDLNFGGGDDDDSASPGDTTVVADGVSFTTEYRGVIFEEMKMYPTFDDDLEVDSVEWLVRAPVFDAPTIVDDATAFVWGEADALDDDGGDEYLLGARFGDDSETTFAWNTNTRFCGANGCGPRSISAVCRADVILRVWLTDGTSLEAVGEHRSARVTCGEEGEQP